ncbi:MAG: HAD family hydrolase [Brevinema sp.]
MNTKLLIFDMDGTLINSADANYHAYSNALKEAGILLSRDFFDVHCFNGQHYTQFLPQLMPNFSEDEIKKVHKRKQEIYAHNMHMLTIHPYLFTLINQNHKNMLLALGTGAAREAVNNVLPTVGLEDVFDFIVTGDDVVNKKPHPECFLTIMDHFKVTPEETVIFEDSDIGLEAARKSGAWVMKVEQWAR